MEPQDVAELAKTGAHGAAGLTIGHFTGDHIITTLTIAYLVGQCIILAPKVWHTVSKWIKKKE